MREFGYWMFALVWFFWPNYDIHGVIGLACILGLCTLLIVKGKANA